MSVSESLFMDIAKFIFIMSDFFLSVVLFSYHLL